MLLFIWQNKTKTANAHNLLAKSRKTSDVSTCVSSTLADISNVPTPVFFDLSSFQDYDRFPIETCCACFSPFLVWKNTKCLKLTSVRKCQYFFCTKFSEADFSLNGHKYPTKHLFLVSGMYQNEKSKALKSYASGKWCADVQKTFYFLFAQTKLQQIRENNEKEEFWYCRGNEGISGIV